MIKAQKLTVINKPKFKLSNAENIHYFGKKTAFYG
jgi:hypothetical protein